MDNVWTYLGPLVSLAVVGSMVAFGFVARKRAMAAGHQTYANYRLVDIAQRTGLSIVEGDPNANLMMAHSEFEQRDYQSTGGVVGRLVGDGTKAMRLLLQGMVWGRPYQFVYAMRRDIDQGLTEVRHTLYFDCRLAARVNAAFPDFEITLRNPQQYLTPRRQFALPPSSFGVPAVDQMFQIYCGDPRVGPAVAPALVPLMTQAFVHFVGGGGEITATTTEFGCYVLFQSIEGFQRALEQMACVCEGRR